MNYPTKKYDDITSPTTKMVNPYTHSCNTADYSTSTCANDFASFTNRFFWLA
jgi:hypothetical protein